MNGKKFNSYGAGEYDNIDFPDKSEYVNAPRSGSYNYWSQNPYGAGDFDDITFPRKSSFTDNAGNFDYEQLMKDVDTYGKSKKQRLTNRGVGDIIKETANNLKNNENLRELTVKIAEKTVSAVMDGLIQGYISDTNGGDFKKGFVDGFVSGMASEFAELKLKNGSDSTKIKYCKKLISSTIGAGVSSIVSDLMKYSNVNSNEEIAQNAVKSVVDNITPELTSEYIDYMIEVANQTGSAMQELLPGYDEKFAKTLKIFFDKLIVTVNALRG